MKITNVKESYTVIPHDIRRFIRDNKLRVSNIRTKPGMYGKTSYSFYILRPLENGKTKQFSVTDLQLPLSKFEVTSNMLITQALPFYSYYATEYGNDNHTNEVDLTSVDKDTLFQYREAQRIKRFLSGESYERLKYLDTEISDSDLPEYTTVDKLESIDTEYIHIVDSQDREQLVNDGYITKQDLENFGSFFQIIGNAEVRAVYGTSKRFMIPINAHCELLYSN